MEKARRSVKKKSRRKSCASCNWRERKRLWRRKSRDDDEPLEGADVYELDNFERRGLRLSDDGELVDLETDDDEWLQEQGRLTQA